MTLSVTERGSGGNNTAGTSFTGVQTNGTIAVGSLGVLIITADNAGSGGNTPACPATITDSVGNVWTRRQNPIYDPGAASAGVETACYTCFIGTALTSSGNANFTWASSVSVTAKRFAFKEITGSAGNPAYRTGGAGTGAASGTPTVTTASVTSGECVVAWGGSESADTWAGDADTSNGNWSTHIHGASGTGTSGMSLTTQHKVVTGTATQTYNPTLTSADQILGWVIIQELADITGTAAPDIDAPTVATSGKERMTGTSAADIDAPGVAATGKERMTGTSSADIDAPSVAATGNVGSLAITGTAAVDIDAPAVAATGKETLTGSAAVDLDAPTVTASGKETVTGTAAPDIDAPSVAASGKETITGSAAPNIDAPTVTSSGLVRLSGTSAVDIDAPAVAGTGSLRITGSGDVSIDAPAVAGTAKTTVSGSGGITIQAPSINAFGTPPDVTGTADISIDAPTITASGIIQLEGGAVLVIAAPTLDAAGVIRFTGTGGVDVNAPAITGTGSVSGVTPPIDLEDLVITLAWGPTTGPVVGPHLVGDDPTTVTMDTGITVEVELE